MEIGFIGLGNVGLPASLNLMRAGYDVLGFDIARNVAFGNAGGRQVERCEDLSRAAVVVQSLPSVNALKASVDALLVNPHAGQVVIDLSSYPLAEKQAQASRLGEHGISMLDCEMSGLAHQVAERKGVIFKSGPQNKVTMLAPVFDAMAERHFYLGEFGAATKMKLIANAMVCVHNSIAAEALVLGERIGLDPAQMIEVLIPSAAGSKTFENKAPLMMRRQFENGSGPFRHMFGYLSRVRELADQVDVATPLIDATTALFDMAEQQGRHDQDIAAMIEILESMTRGDSK
jgi:L-threonate 2-dehydrogenase